ncbi:MAG: gamma-glutamyl-gamma-aminobutyrate hydrolase family protein, partial [Pseudonocardia sp.]
PQRLVTPSQRLHHNRHSRNRTVAQPKQRLFHREHLAWPAAARCTSTCPRTPRVAGQYDTNQIQITPGNRLAAALGESATVLCAHHQGIDRVGSGLEAVVWAPDGTIEDIEDPSAPFCGGCAVTPRGAPGRPRAVRGINPGGRRSPLTVDTSLTQQSRLGAAARAAAEHHASCASTTRARFRFSRLVSGPGRVRGR